MKQSVIHLGPDISQSFKKECAKLCEKTGLELVERGSYLPNPYDLVWEPDKQVLGLYLGPGQVPLTLDLCKQWQFFSRGDLSKKGPLPKALGKKAFQGALVWDATAGSGRDLCHLLALGVARLWAFERHPVVYALLSFEVRQLKAFLDPGIELEVIFAEASSFNSVEPAEALFYDPMYPEKRKKSSLSRRVMEVFKEMVGPDLDEKECLEKLIRSEHKRIVLKRPLKSLALVPGVSAQFKGSTTRYDLYV